MPNLRDANVALNRTEYETRQTRLASRPTRLYVELTQNCNLKCKMCRSGFAYDPSKDMSAELFDLIVEQLFPYAELIDLRGWGESTILRSFAARLRVALGSGARVHLFTNALGMTETLWNMFFEGDNVVAVSFDSADADMFGKLGRGDFHRVVRNVRLGAEIRRRTGRGLLYFNVVVNSFTVSELTDIVRLAADIGLPKVMVYPIFCPEHHVANLTHAVDRIPAALDAAAAAARELGVELQLGTSLDESLTVDYGLPSTCANPWNNALIDYEGRIGFCNHLLNSPELTLGSLRESTFDEIWNGPGFVGLRDEHVRAERSRELSTQHSKCTWCYLNRYAEAEYPEATGDDRRRVSSKNGRPLYQVRSREPVVTGAQASAGRRLLWVRHG